MKGIFGILKKKNKRHLEKSVKDIVCIMNKFEWYFLYLENKLKVYLGFSISVEGTLVFSNLLPGVSGHGLVGLIFFLYIYWISGI